MPITPRAPAGTRARVAARGRDRLNTWSAWRRRPAGGMARAWLGVPGERGVFVRGPGRQPRAGQASVTGTEREHDACAARSGRRPRVTSGSGPEVCQALADTVTAWRALGR